VLVQGVPLALCEGLLLGEVLSQPGKALLQFRLCLCPLMREVRQGRSHYLFFGLQFLWLEDGVKRMRLAWVGVVCHWGVLSERKTRPKGHRLPLW
jgi:hypothetical protein